MRHPEVAARRGPLPNKRGGVRLWFSRRGGRSAHCRIVMASGDSRTGRESKTFNQVALGFARHVAPLRWVSSSPSERFGWRGSFRPRAQNEQVATQWAVSVNASSRYADRQPVAGRFSIVDELM